MNSNSRKNALRHREITPRGVLIRELMADYSLSKASIYRYLVPEGA
ncbi:MAG: hypothetical protein OXF74_09565 [Rhodobacteraceae bacterium]|nr:hypothetical protein [Paracoccaceae bacterium]